MAFVDPILAQVQALTVDNLVADAVDLPSRTVSVSLYRPPASLVGRISALFGDTVRIEYAANSSASIHAAWASVESHVTGWLSQGVDVRHLSTTLDGYLEIGVASDTVTAQSAFDTALGSGLTRVVSDTDTIELDATRGSDSSPWNGGDEYYVIGTDGDPVGCTSGFNLVTGSAATAAASGRTFMLVSSHCLSPGQSLYNGYYRCPQTDSKGNCEWSFPGSDTPMGACCFRKNIVAQPADDPNQGTHDAALIDATGGVNTIDFDGPWNGDSVYTAPQTSSTTNTPGEYVCISNGWDGNRCSVKITKGPYSTCNNANPTPAYVSDTGGACRDDLLKGSRDDGQWVTGHADSGSPVYTWSGSSLQARGIVDGHGGDVDCPSDSAYSGRRCGTVVYFEDIRGIMDHWPDLDLHLYKP